MRKSLIVLSSVFVLTVLMWAGLKLLKSKNPESNANEEVSSFTEDSARREGNFDLHNQVMEADKKSEDDIINQSRLNLRFLDASTGYAVTPDLVEIKSRGSSSDVLRSTAHEITENGTLQKTLSNGTYDIWARKDGYLPMSTFFELNNNDLKVNFNLEPVKPNEELSSKYIRSLQKPDAIVVIGYVVDDNTGKPLADVKVLPDDSSASAQTDNNGFFQFLLPLPTVATEIGKRNVLRFQKSGYTTELRRNFDMWPNGDLILQIRMKRGEGQHEERILQARAASISLLDSQR